METTPSFGYWVRRQRKALDLTQRALAERVGCALETIKKIEADERRPSHPMAELLAKEIRITPTDHPLFLQCAAGHLSPARLTMAQQPLSEALSLGNEPPKLPTQLTPFVGRELELRQITAQLESPTCRLLTLLGPGGIGKTRLALQAVENLGGKFSHGIYFVELASVNAADALPVTLLHVFHLPQQAQVRPEEQLVTYLRSKQLLLVLDNFEHLREGVGLIKQLLDGAKGLKILITSRERLKLQAEWLLSITGLNVPVEIKETPTTIATFDAIRLFVQGAQRVSPEFELTTEKARIVAHICRVLEGMPLAIELAAAWTRILACSEIEQVFEHDLDFLSTSNVDMPARHRSILVVFEHSWRLLSIQQQSALGELSCFHNGFRYEAANVVTGTSLALLSDLVDKSWLRVSDGRFTMHELVRQFIVRQFSVQGERANTEVQARHSSYFGTFLHQREVKLRGAEQLETLREIEAEVDNIRAGWGWAIEFGQVNLIEQYLKSFQWVGLVRGWNQTMQEIFAQAVTKLQMHLWATTDMEATNLVKIVLAKALHCQAQHAVYLGMLEKSQHLCAESLAYLSSAPGNKSCISVQTSVRLTLALALYDQGKYIECEHHCQEAGRCSQANHDMLGYAESLWLLGLTTFTLGQFREAEQQLGQSLVIFKQIGDQWGQAWALGVLCSLFIAQSNYTQAEQYAIESFHIRRAFDHRLGMAYTRLNFGDIAAARQQYANARQHYEIALEIGEEMNDAHVRGASLRQLGVVAYRTGDHRLAQRFYAESLHVFQSAGRQADIALTLLGIGEVACVLGDYRTAHNSFQKALLLLHAHQAIPEALQGFILFSNLLICVGKTEEAIKLLIFAHHHPMINKEMSSRADQLLTHLQPKFATEQWEATLTSGQSMTLDEALKRVHDLSVPP